jgi:hypothetical protein
LPARATLQLSVPCRSGCRFLVCVCFALTFLTIDDIPEEEFNAVGDRLEQACYEPVIVTDLEPYCVVTDKYDEYAEILKRLVVIWERYARTIPSASKVY